MRSNPAARGRRTAEGQGSGAEDKRLARPNGSPKQPKKERRARERWPGASSEHDAARRVASADDSKGKKGQEPFWLTRQVDGGRLDFIYPTEKTRMPMWSEDQQDFVPAGTLQRDEHLLGRDGRRVRITDITPRAGPEPVYNLQVHGEHVYQVGSDGLLVHNSKVRAGGAPNRGATHYTDFADEAAEIMENAARSPAIARGN